MASPPKGVSMGGLLFILVCAIFGELFCWYQGYKQGKMQQCFDLGGEMVSINNGTAECQWRQDGPRR